MELLEITKKSSFKDLCLWWDIGKRKIREIAIWCSKVIARVKKTELQRLDNRINILSNMPDQILELKKCQNDLRKLHESRAEGVKIRSRAQWWEEGEKPTKYFHDFKKNGKDKSWYKILKTDGTLAFGTEAIQYRQVEFYKDLYCTQNLKTNCNLEGKFLGNLEKKLSKTSKIHWKKT